jgi:hypothetical protein
MNRDEVHVLKKMTETNYHNSLSVLYPIMDRIIHVFRKQKNEGKLEQSWIAAIAVLPIKNIADTQKTFDAILKAIGAIFPLLVGTTLLSYLSTLWTSNKIIVSLTGAAAFIITYVLLLLIRYLPKMLDVRSKYFHLGAYRDRRPREFEIFINAFNDNDFSFEGLFHFVNGVLTHKEDESKAIEALIRHFESERREYKQRIHDLDVKHQNAINEYQALLDDINTETIELEQVTNYLTEFLSEINIILFRMNNNQFSISDLRFLTGFTIYELENDKLIKLPNGDHGTTGASVSEIIIGSSKFKDYSAVKVLNDQDSLPVYQEVRPGYIIVSYKMKMGIGNNKVWVFNYHVNTALNEKAWNLLLNDDILNTSEVYRLFHALCLLLIKQGFGAEGLENVSS